MKLTVCSLQPTVYWQRPAHTLAALEALMAQAAAGAPDWVLWPEHFDAALAPDGDQTHWQAMQDFAAAMARQHNVNLAAGSVERWDARRGARFNTAVVYNRRGEEIGRYDKRRLFGFEQRRGVQPGNAALRLEVDGVRVGLLICSDFWYPELTRPLALSCDLLLVPAQTTIRPESDPAYARTLWHSLALTRAQENAVAVAVSDQAAFAEAPFRCGGASSFSDPGAGLSGAALQYTLADGRIAVLTHTVDLAQLAEFRAYRRSNGLLPPEEATQNG